MARPSAPLKRAHWFLRLPDPSVFEGSGLDTPSLLNLCGTTVTRLRTLQLNARYAAPAARAPPRLNPHDRRTGGTRQRGPVSSACEDTPRRERRPDTITARVRALVSAASLDRARDERALRQSLGSGSVSDYATNRALRPSCQRTFPGALSRGVIRPT